tara:strand:- start:252 stop:419 length:168 start_codon:yes stop_codon:yes gene_type:complete
VQLQSYLLVCLFGVGEVGAEEGAAVCILLKLGLDVIRPELKSEKFYREGNDIINK